MIKTVIFVAALATTTIAQAKNDNTISGRDLISVTGLACDSISLGRLTRWAAKADFYNERVSMNGIKVADGQVRSKKHAIKIEQKDGRFIMAIGGRKVTGQNVCDLVVNFAESEANEKVSLLSLAIPTAQANVLDQQAKDANAAANAAPAAAANANSNSAVAAPASTVTVAAPASSSATETVAAPATTAAPATETVAVPAATSTASGPEVVATTSGGTSSDVWTPTGVIKPAEGPVGTTGGSGSGSGSKRNRNASATAAALAAAAAAVAGGVANPNPSAVPAVALSGGISAEQLKSLLLSLASDDIKVKCSKKKVTIQIAGKRIVVNKKKDTVKILPKSKNSDQTVPNSAELIAMAKTCDSKDQAKAMEDQFKNLLTGTNVAVEQSIASERKAIRGIATVQGNGTLEAGQAKKAQ